VRVSSLFLTEFCLGDKKNMDHILQRSDIIGFDVCLFKLLSVKFRISMTSSQLEFEFMELEGF